MSDKKGDESGDTSKEVDVVSVEDFKRMESRMDAIQILLEQLVANKEPTNSNTTPPLAPSTIVANPIPKGDQLVENPLGENGKDDGASSQKWNGTGEYRVEPPPKWFSLDPPIPHPHVIHQGQPPK